MDTDSCAGSHPGGPGPRPRGTGRLRRPLTTAVLGVVVGASVLSGTATPALAGDVSGSDRAVRVLSFNIHHAQGTDGLLDLPRVADVIRSTNAQIVGLQEVDRHWSERSEFEDQATRLAEALRMHVVFGANLDLDPPGPQRPRRQFGTAILSRYPILDWDNTLLPRFGDHEQRGLLRARINLRGVAVQAYTTHLQHNDAAERLEQAKAILELIGEPGTPVVLTGDLNASPEAPEVRHLTGRLLDTWIGDGGYTHPSEQPDQRIDYVLTSDDVVTRAAAVVTDMPVASDHLPVVSDLVLKAPG